MSLRRRVLLGFTAVAVVLLAADLLLASTFRGYLLEQVDTELAEAAERIAFRPSRSFDPRPGGRGGFGTGGRGALSGFYIAVTDPDGHLLGRIDEPLSRFGEDAPSPAPEEVTARATPARAPLRPFDAQDGQGRGWRMVAVESAQGGALVLVGSPLSGVEATYRRMIGVLAAATAVVLAMLATVAAWVLRQGVRPLVAMTATAEAIAQGALSERVADTDQRTEAGRLGHALNRMLTRIEDAFAARAASEGRLRRFVADASHELRTPLTSIRGYAELYRAGGLPPGADLDEALRRIEEEAQRMGGLVEDLLTLAKLDEGRPLDRGPVDLAAIAEDAARDARAVEPDRPITITAEPVEIIGDEARLRQALGNFLANARTHTPPGTPVHVTVSRRGDAAVVEVADEGPGMPPEVAARVFDRFYRADPARARPRGGSGLGLAVVAGIAAAHGGAAEVDADPGAGSRFRLRLPLPDGA
jgi:two-component system, OmpR family, sensor kinase